MLWSCKVYIGRIHGGVGDGFLREFGCLRGMFKFKGCTSSLDFLVRASLGFRQQAKFNQLKPSTPSYCGS